MSTVSVYCGRKDLEILLAIAYVTVGIVYYAYSESLSLNWKIGKRKCLKLLLNLTNFWVASGRSFNCIFLNQS